MPYENFDYLQYKVLKKKMDDACGRKMAAVPVIGDVSGRFGEKKQIEKEEEKMPEESSFVLVKPVEKRGCEDVHMETSLDRARQADAGDGQMSLDAQGNPKMVKQGSYESKASFTSQKDGLGNANTITSSNKISHENLKLI